MVFQEEHHNVQVAVRAMSSVFSKIMKNTANSCQLFVFVHGLISDARYQCSDTTGLWFEATEP